MLSSTGKKISEQSTSAVNVVVIVPTTCVSVVGEHVDVVVMKEHETKYFTCETSARKPVTTFQWYKDNRTLDKITDDIPFYPSSFNTTIIVDSSVRSVLNYKAARHDHSVSIYCTANNVGAVSVSETKIKLIISSRVPYTPEEPDSNDSTDELDSGILTALAVLLCMLHGM
ncbi:uncharacterized protein LOC127834867 [Dreissena polymorpha]|uniref:uncharacterized protein LOC127834867 n=1 Tax=Dreissena polymorpha TaxID=45954 RepID=UPI00226437AB|nr:uncharacterized protein LOC127834867 [Dreissena polymorpha]